MSWWRNSDPIDDENELEIKASIFASFLLVVITLSCWIIFTGCAQHVKVFECKANCDDTTLECTTSVSGSELDFN